MFQFRRLLSRYQPFLPPAAALITALFIVFFAIYPAVRQTLQQFQDVNALREQVTILQQKVSVLNNLDESGLEQNVALTTSAVPLEKSLPTVLSTMEGISETTGVVLKSLVIDSPGSLASQSANKQQQSTEEKKLGASAIAFSVTLSGSFDQIKSFLATSNKVRRLVRAKSFTLNFSEEQLTTQIAFETFYAPLTKRNETEELQTLKNKDFDLLAALEQYPNMTTTGVNTTPVLPQTEIKANPFSL